MPKVTRSHVAYRYEPYMVDDPESEEHWTDDGYAPINLDTAVPVPTVPRILQWNRILKHIPSERRDEMRDLILTSYLDHFIDGDHKVELVDEVLRFKAVAWDSLLIDHVNLNAISVARQQGKITTDVYRRFHRALGYSLAGLAELSHMGHHAFYGRMLREPGRLIAAHCPVWMLQ